jgi:hypothetical protein
MGGKHAAGDSQGFEAIEDLNGMPYSSKSMKAMLPAVLYLE